MKLTLDYLPKSKLQLYQRKDMFRINTDTFALLQFMTIHPNETVLDIGTNNGALLLEASLYSPKQLIGIDVLSEAIDVARMNMELHQIMNVDLQAIGIQEYRGPKVDVIISNPPYFNPHTVKQVSQSSKLQQARFQTSLTIDELFDAIARLLSKEGRTYIVFRADYLFELLVVASKHQLYLQKLQTVEDTRRSSVSTVCLQFGFKQTKTVILNSLKIGETNECNDR